MTAWTAESLPPELTVILDEQAGRAHSPSGAVRRCLADILNAYDAWREDQERPDPAAEYGGDLRAPLCCCKRGSMCAACGSGEHWQCPDRDDQGDEPDTAGGWYCNNANCDCRDHEDDDD